MKEQISVKQEDDTINVKISDNSERRGLTAQEILLCFLIACLIFGFGWMIYLIIK